MPPPRRQHPTDNGAPQPRWCRRRALGRLAAGAAGMSMPAIVPVSALAQSATRGAGSAEPPPSERLNVAVIGLGDASVDHLRKLLPREDVFVRAVCDVEAGKLARGQATVERSYRAAKDRDSYAGCLATGDHREVVALADVDGVVIATPPHWHAAIALDAIHAGKDVLCQAPMSLTVREGQMVAEAADQYGIVFQVVSPQRCEGQMVYACELVRNGYLGDVREVYVSVGQFGVQEELPEQAVPDGFDYDRWLGPAPWAPYHAGRIASGPSSGWRRYWEYGDRKHGAVGYGHYDIVQWALGTEGTCPVEFVPEGFEGAPYATFRYQDGAVVKIDHPTEGDEHIQFVGAQGDLMVSTRGSVKGEPRDLTRVKIAPGDVRLREDNSAEASWVESIKTRRQPVADAGVGRRSAAICHLNAIAERLRRPVKFDPAKEEILDDPHAARQLDRPRRAPYALI